MRPDGPTLRTLLSGLQADGFMAPGPWAAVRAGLAEHAPPSDQPWFVSALAGAGAWVAAFCFVGFMATIDLIPRWEGGAIESFSKVFSPGKLVQVGPATMSTGGAVSNTGQALQKLGLRTLLMAKIGRDTVGDIVRGLLRSNGADDSGMSSAENDQSSYSVVLAPPGMDRIFHGKS